MYRNYRIYNKYTKASKDDYDYEWEEQGRRFLVIFNSNYKSVMYIHDVQKEKFIEILIIIVVR
jgi:hypothetical protein